MYTWGYLKSVALAKLDLTESEAEVQGLIERFPYYANEVITQICSAIKPKATCATFNISKNDIGVIKTMPSDFVSFGDDVNERSYQQYNATFFEECHDDDLRFLGYNQIMFKKEGVYQISYNARWIDFANITRPDGLTGPVDSSTELDVPMDILDCIPPYIASQCFKIDDQYKSQVYRNEYEMSLARIDNTTYKNTKTFKIEGDW